MRSYVNLKPRLAAGLLGLGAVLALAAPAAQAAPVQADYSAAVQKAAGWVAAQQQPDGSFPGFGVGSTADAMIALAAATPARMPMEAGSRMQFLAGKAPDYVKSPGAAAKLLLGLMAGTDGSYDPQDFGGVDLLQVIGDSYDRATGHYGQDVTGQALVILALKNREGGVPPAALAWLAGAQSSEGGWSFDGSTGPGSADTNTTGLVLQALGAAGRAGDPAVATALAYLHTQQNADAGFAYQKGPGADSDANSTAMVVLGLLAVGQDPDGKAWQQGGPTPRGFLLTLQNPSGALRYQIGQPEDNAGATYQAIPALAGVRLPIDTSLYRGPVTPGMPRTGAGRDLAALPVLLLAGLALALAGRRLRPGAVR